MFKIEREGDNECLLVVDELLVMIRATTIPLAKPMRNNALNTEERRQHSEHRQR